MHKIQAKEFTLNSFSYDHLMPLAKSHLEQTIKVLNEYKPLIKMLYSFKNEAMGKSEHLKIDNRELFGYGSGYGILPYFESGVGTSCYYKILNTIGLELKNINDSLYVITRK